MRITHNMIVGTTLRNISSNAGRLNKLQEQMGSTYRLNRLSDDPLALIVSLDSRSKIYAMDQYVKNLDSADAWLTGVEAAMMEMNSLVSTIYTDVIDAATDVKNASDRVAIAQKVREFRDQLLSAANATLTDRYLFGGYNASEQPFSVVNGVLYYNGMSMYSSEQADINVEEFVHKGLNALYTQSNDEYNNVNPTMTKEEIVALNREMHAAMETVLDAARSVYSSRTVPDLGNPGEYVEQNTAYMIHAMQTTFDANVAAGNWTARQQNAAQAVIDALREGNAANILESGESMSVLDAMKALEQLTENAKEMIDEMENKANRGELHDSGATIDFMKDERDAAAALSQSAVEAAQFRLAEEGDKKYEIEVGYGQLLSITMNGVEVMGTGDSNLYKIIDDLYFALTREYTDTTHGGESFVFDVMSHLAGITDPPPAPYATYADAISEAAGGLSGLAALGANLLSSKYVVNPTYGPEAQVDNVMQYLTEAAALTGAATDTDYRDALDDVTDLLTAVAQVGVNMLNSGTSTHLQIEQAMRAAATAYTPPIADADAVVDSMISTMQSGLEGGMSYTEASTALQQTINALNATNAAVAADASTNVADLQAIVAGRAATAAEKLSAAQGSPSEIPPELTKDEIFAMLSQAIDPDWPQEAKDAAGTMIKKIEDALNAGMTFTQVATNLRLVSEQLGSLGATSTSAADTAVALGLAEAAYLSSTQGIKSGSIAVDVTPFITPLQSAQKDLMAKLAIVGGRTNRIDILQERYSLDDLNYTTRISKLEDIDMAEALTMYKVAESVYNASLQVGAEIMQLSLLDFMR